MNNLSTVIKELDKETMKVGAGKIVKGENTCQKRETLKISTYMYVDKEETNDFVFLKKLKLVDMVHVHV